MITKTVGSGGDYATWKAAWDAVIAAAPLADDWTLNQISDVTETTATSVASAVDLNAKTVLLTSALSHGGVFSGGYKTYLSQATSSLQFKIKTTGGSTGTIRVSGLNIQDTIRKNASVAALKLNDNTNPTVGCTFQVDSTLLLGYDRVNTNVGFSCQSLFYGNSASIFDVKLCGFYYGMYLLPSAYTPGGALVRTRAIENCSLYGCTVGIKTRDGDATGLSNKKEFRNCTIAASSSKDVEVDDGGNHDYFINCSDSDGSMAAEAQGTYTNCVGGVTAADEFVSTDPTSADFLKPKRTGTIYALGTTPTLTTTDIAGKAIPDAFGCYPIGCHVGERTGLPIDVTCAFLNIGDSRV